MTATFLGKTLQVHPCRLVFDIPVSHTCLETLQSQQALATSARGDLLLTYVLLQIFQHCFGDIHSVFGVKHIIAWDYQIQLIFFRNDGNG